MVDIPKILEQVANVIQATNTSEWGIVAAMVVFIFILALVVPARFRLLSFVLTATLYTLVGVVWANDGPPRYPSTWIS
jgi:hypothetical protein